MFVEPGEDKTFAMIPNSGCSVQKVVVDGVDVGPVESYTFRSVNSDHTIHVQFSGLGVDNHTSLDLKVYPNPAKESLIVEGENMKRIAVFSLLGVQMASQEVNDSHTSLNIDSLTKGTYILKVEYADGTVGYMRFVAADWYSSTPLQTINTITLSLRKKWDAGGGLVLYAWSFYN